MNTNINIYMVLIILFSHWIADFVIQTDTQAQGKSNNWKDLIEHTISYSFLCATVISIAYTSIYSARLSIFHYLKFYFLFWFITISIHTATDYYTSRVNKKLWEDKKTHDFFVSIGFDQFLHFTQLLITYQILTK